MRGLIDGIGDEGFDAAWDGEDNVDELRKMTPEGLGGLKFRVHRAKTMEEMCVIFGVSEELKKVVEERRVRAKDLGVVAVDVTAMHKGAFKKAKVGKVENGGLKRKREDESK